MKKINLLISACLLGIPCRYDGKGVPRVAFSELSEYFNIIPVCPEIYGGLPTPRTPSERWGDRVVMADGRDVTDNFRRGAEAAYALCRDTGTTVALLKEKSPSCGKGKIYDGSFSGKLTDGDGYTAEYLSCRGIAVFGESQLAELIELASSGKI